MFIRILVYEFLKSFTFLAPQGACRNCSCAALACACKFLRALGTNLRHKAWTLFRQAAAIFIPLAPIFLLKDGLLSGNGRLVGEREGYPDEQGGGERQQLAACSMAASFDRNSSSLTWRPSCSSTSLRATMPIASSLSRFVC